MLSEKINEDLKNAMKQGDKERLNALRNLKARFIENKTAAKVLPEQDVLVSYYKKLKDSINNFPEGHALRLSTEKELKFLDPYMPAQMTEIEVRTIIQTIVGKLEKPNMGAVMKELSPQIKGLFDGKRANDLVKEILG
ncbi:MAG: GatB/YqeY domain-containing protein [Bdellovibrio sp.]|nr:GatB/YqeY domain-containing protein [Bdellovibrio sp.]